MPNLNWNYLKSFFGRAKAGTKDMSRVKEEIKRGVENLNEVKKGKMKAKPLNDLLNEL